MTTSKLMQEAYDLIKLAGRLGPEGEGLDLTDQEYSLEHIVELRSTLASMRSAIDEVNRALAQAWAYDYQGESFEYDDDDWYLGYCDRRTFRDRSGVEFAKWLKEQPVEKIAQIVKPDAIRVSPLGGPDDPLRQELLDETRTSDMLRIQHRPVRRK